MLFQFLKHRRLIATLAANELRTRYMGTFAGLLWNFISPLVMALIYWFIFSTIFYAGRVIYEGYELQYICYFLAGYAPWLLFQETVLRSANAIADNPNYVKKIVFPLGTLAFIHFLAGSISHLVILGVLLAIMLSSGISVSPEIFLIIPYYLLLALFTLGISWVISAINVFVRDAAHVVALVLNVWFWFCPIVWVMSAMPEKFRFVFALNPFLFFIDGYRGALFSNLAPQSPGGGLPVIYVMIVFAVFFVGQYIFQRLQSHFGDMV